MIDTMATPEPISPTAALAWQIDAGADEAIAEAPQDRFAETRARAQARAQTAAPAQQEAAAPPTPPTSGPAPDRPPAPARPATPVAQPPLGGEAADSARDLAAGCATIADIVDAIGRFDGCALKRTATNTVVYDGNPEARLMIVGEAPGAEEDRKGKPFVGPAGQLLDRMLAAIGMDRTSCYITNILNWRPPGNRSPTAEEIATCQPFVERQIAILQPSALVLTGGISAKALLGRKEGITRLRGKWHEIAVPGLDGPVAAMATFHPAYLLRQPAAKREVWRDLQAIASKLRDSGN